MLSFIATSVALGTILGPPERRSRLGPFFDRRDQFELGDEIFCCLGNNNHPYESDLFQYLSVASLTLIHEHQLPEACCGAGLSRIPRLISLGLVIATQKLYLLLKRKGREWFISSFFDAEIDNVVILATT